MTSSLSHTPGRRVCIERRLMLSLLIRQTTSVAGPVLHMAETAVAASAAVVSRRGRGRGKGWGAGLGGSGSGSGGAG